MRHSSHFSEQARDTKGSYQATSDKMEDVLDLDYDEGSPNCAQERADDGDEGEAVCPSVEDGSFTEMSSIIFKEFRWGN